LINKYTKQLQDCIKIKQGSCFVTLCITLMFTCVACAPRSIYYDKSFNPPVYFGQHIVQKGETLYAIAWRYGRAFKELARANKIKAPYVIVPGEKINLERAYFITKIRGKEGINNRSSNANVTKRKYSTKNNNNVTKNKKHNKLKNIEWQWPHIGPILAKYKRGARGEKGGNAPSSLNKGLDIAGKLGSPIYAAAGGEVVYAGNGLLGYGNLVIINHNEMYLSAYAHNKEILVKEGQKITKGEKIARMGLSENKRALLHFEIRRNGQPVDPMKYLPRQ